MNRVDERTEELIQDVLDGGASPEDRARLREILARDPAARERHAALAPLYGALNESQCEDPPAELRANVLRAIEAMPRKAAAGPGWFAGVFSTLARRPGWTLAYGFSAGAVVAVTVVTLVAGGLGPHTRAGLPVAGSIAPMSARSAATLVSREKVLAGDAEVTLETWRDLDAVELRVWPGGAAGLETEVSYDERVLRTTGVSWLQSGRHTFDVMPGHAVTRQVGDEPFRLDLTASADAPLHVTLRRGGSKTECTLGTASTIHGAEKHAKEGSTTAPN